MRLSRAILCFLIFGFIGHVVFYYPNLPAQVASHFNAYGEADGWMSRKSFLVLESIILALIILEFTLLPILLRKTPDSLINLPNKSYWLAEERRDETFRTMGNYFEWLAVGLFGLFISLNHLIFRANITKTNIPPTTMWVPLSLFLIFVVLWLIKLTKHFRIKEYEN